MSGTVDVAAFTAFERDGWDRIPDAYHRLLGPVTVRAADRLLDASGAGPGTRLLDVGSGPGYVAGRAAARGARAVGVDLSPKSVALAHSLHAGVEFRVADAAALPFGEAAFDAVVAGFLLPHLARHELAVAEFVRVVAPGGTVAVSTWDRPERVPLLGAVVGAVADVGAPPPVDLPQGPAFFRFSDRQALMELLRGAGLTDVRVTSAGFAHRVASADHLWDSVLSGSVRTAALVAGQPEPARRTIRAAFDRRVAAFAVDGALELPVSVLVARGRRPPS